MSYCTAHSAPNGRATVDHVPPAPLARTRDCSALCTVERVVVRSLQGIEHVRERVHHDHTPTVIHLRAELRRLRAALALVAATSRPDAGVIIIDRLTVDLLRDLVLVDGYPVHVSPAAWCVLTMFARHPGTLYTAAEIGAYLDAPGRRWPGDRRSSSTWVGALIYRLRRELGPAGDLIVSERGAGWGLALVEDDL